MLTVRACWWAVRQMRFEHASVSGLARQLGVTWKTLWRAIRPLVQAMADDNTRFDGVERLGVDEHVWHHVSPLPAALDGRGPKELTGMVDCTPGPDGAEGPFARSGPRPVREGLRLLARKSAGRPSEAG